MLYRVSADGSTVFNQIATTITQHENTVTITPTIPLDEGESYMLIIVGGDTGIKSITNSPLSENYVALFHVSSLFKPVEPPISPDITSDTVIVNPDTSYELDAHESYDVFTSSADATTMTQVVGIMPPDRSIIRGELTTITIVVNGEALPLDSDSIDVHYAELPVDPDPFADRKCPVTTEVNGSAIIIRLVTPLSLTNREIFLSIPRGFIQAKDKLPDNEGLFIQCIGVLSPLYATPDSVYKKLMLLFDGNVLLSNYDCIKLIHEKSIVLDMVPKTPKELIAYNDLIACLIIRDIILFGRTLNGRVKSRDLLATTVQYENVDIPLLNKAVEDCIDNALSVFNIDTKIAHGIKSSAWMNRPTKIYGIYR
jgi:hypothetical protein